MTEFWHNFEFLRPWLLLLLLFPAGLYFLRLRNGGGYSSWQKACDKNLLEFLLVKSPQSGQKMRMFLVYLGLITAVLAAAGPSWQKNAAPVLVKENPLMILLDMSSDMLADDIRPNRLVRAKIEISDLLAQVQNAETGLIVYSDEPFVVSPLSADSALIVNLLPALDRDIMPVNGNRLDRAINLAVEKIHAAGYNNGSIVVFSATAGTRFELTQEAARRAARQNIYVSVMNMAATDQDNLARVAKAGDGIMAGMTDVESLVAFLNTNYHTQLKETANQMARRADDGWYLLALPMLCCLYFFRRGFLVVLLMIAWSSSAFAGFWQSDDYTAKKLFESQDYAAAAQKFSDPRWRAAALYRGQDYEAAGRYFQKGTGIEDRYNYGNALAKSGKIADAIAVYEQVLKEAPDHEDAKFNLEYLKQQQQQKSPQQNQQNQNQDEQQKQQSAANEQQNQSDQQQNPEQNADSQDQKDQNKQEQQNQSSAQTQVAQDSNEKSNEESVSEASSSQDEKQQNQNRVEQQKSAAAPVKEGEKDDQYDEQVQARQQQFREIPEDRGGLLRAFILKEYQKNRYGE